ncbi:MAG: DUF1513 domain-containing protein [Pelagimonas sp.]|uniref:DUF1513 domain-containing protein n=1 Tax=Pelagimonas sp. TaxID=2073170 RepID=UPI003D6C466F
MTGRRGFLTGLLSASLFPVPSWADVGSPALITAAKTAQGAYVLVGLNADLEALFRLPLPSRGHAAAAHPSRPEAVAFARRPGTYALVLDCRNGDVLAQMQAPSERHFYGHGAFSGDGTRLFTSENDYEAGRGVIGVWDATRDYARIGEFSSGGVGPHELALMPDGQTLVVANGGIDTHPDSGRAKLNIPEMRPNLSYFDLGGGSLETQELPKEFRRNSIRHLDVRADGLVAFGMQWQGDTDRTPPLVGAHMRGQDIVVAGENPVWRDMKGYVGSVSFSQNGQNIVVTSPRGGRVVQLGASDLVLGLRRDQADVCGVAALGPHIVTTTGHGTLWRDDHMVATHRDLAFDNHLVAIDTGHL